MCFWIEYATIDKKLYGAFSEFHEDPAHCFLHSLCLVRRGFHRAWGDAQCDVVSHRHVRRRDLRRAYVPMQEAQRAYAAPARRGVL